MVQKYAPQFTPHIEATITGGYMVTAPRAIREKIYKAVEELQDGVVKKDGDTTTVTIKTNRGNQKELGFHILVVATYIALFEDIEDLLRVKDLDEHFTEIKQKITFGTIQVPQFTKKDIAPWIDAYLCAATTKMLNDSILGQFNTLDGGLKSYISQTNLMKNRITVEVNSFWNLATRIKWLRQCEDALTYFNERLMALKEIARFIDQKYKEAQEVIQLYYNHMTKTGPVGQIAVYREAEKSLSQIMASVQEARREINKEEIKEVFETVSTLLPPVSKQ